MTFPLPDQYRVDPPTMEEITNSAATEGELLALPVICYSCQLGECGGNEFFFGKDGSMWSCDHECHPDAGQDIEQGRVP